MSIKIDYSRDSLFDELGLTRLRESYMREDETSPQERFAYVAQTFSSDDAHAQRLYDYASKHWLSFATPILSYGRSKRGLPISCFLSYLDDSSDGLITTLSEVNTLSMLGGGVGIHVGIRAADDKSTGVMPHLKVYDASSLAYRQGRTRRGSYAAFLNISHPDIVQFMEMRKPTGDQNFRTLNLHHGVNITDDFMLLIEGAMRDPDFDDSWPLINPNNGETVEVVRARDVWEKLLKLRMETGEPYLIFIDTANNALPDHLNDQGLRINGSNLCTEIFLPTSEDRTAVCCLSSLNLEYFDDWKGEKTFIRDVAEMLDNVLQYFIDNAPDAISRARFSAERERSIGIGALGFHAFLQKKMVPFDSAMAKAWNLKIFNHIYEECDRANSYLSALRGPCPDAGDAGYSYRFSHMTAIAPNASSSLIMGNTSPSIEPYRANVFRQDTMSGAFVYKNRFLKAKLAEIGMDTDEVWSSIISNDGSVQHLDIADNIKDVFKTAPEIDQMWLIAHAADRQPYIDQGQSVNLFFYPNVNVKYLHACHYAAWAKGLKSLYYCRSDKLRKADKVSTRIERKKIEEEIDFLAVMEGADCIACEG